MAVTSQSRPRLASNRNLVSDTTSVTSWVRPSAWLSLPDVSGQQRFAGLHKIDVDGNLVAIIAAGAYTVDWGDGTTTNHTSGSTAQKNYNYSTISSTGESTLGYRQVIIQVYPQSGQNLTTLNLNVRNTTTSHSYAGGWLDVVVNGSNLTSLTFSGSTTPARLLQQATVLQHNLTSTSNLLVNCNALQSVPLFDTALVTNMLSMFQNCFSLQSVPLFNTASATSMTAMFQGCVSLQSVPLFNTALVTNMTSMFQGCASLQSVPLFNTALVTNMTSIFNDCRSLVSVPLFNTGSVTNMTSMFNTCTSLKSIPLFNTASVTNMTNMFNACSSLSSVPLLNTASVTTMTGMFTGCLSLNSVPLFNTASATTMAAMFRSCFRLLSVPLFNMASVTNVSLMFDQCLALTTIPALNLSAVSSAANMNAFVGSGTPISSAACTGINQTVSFTNCKLSAAQINAIFSNLSATGSGKTITVTGNYGAATCTTSIATAKGWTVAT